MWVLLFLLEIIFFVIFLACPNKIFNADSSCFFIIYFNTLLYINLFYLIVYIRIILFKVLSFIIFVLNENRPIDPFTKLKIPETFDGEIMDIKTRELGDVKPSYLDKLRLNLVVSLGSPFRVKYDLVERALSILRLIENDKNKLNSPGWILIYKGFWNSAQRELTNLDPVWKDLQTKRSSQDQLKAFSNIEIFIEYHTYLSDYLKGLDNLSNGELDDDALIGVFIEFMKEKGMFIE